MRYAPFSPLVVVAGALTMLTLAHAPALAQVAAAARTSTAAQTGPPVRDAQRSFYSYPRTWKAIRDQNIVKQQRDFSCGAAALATVGRYYWGDPITEQQVLKVIEGNLSQEELRERIQNGLAITDLRLAAVKLGYLSTIGRLEIGELQKAKVPLVVAIRLEETDHFVVVRGMANGWVFLADPMRGNVRMPQFEFEQRWIENAVLVVAKRGQTQSSVSRLGVTHEELSRGWLNEQLLRTAPEKTFRTGFRSVP